MEPDHGDARGFAARNRTGERRSGPSEKSGPLSPATRAFTASPRRGFHVKTTTVRAFGHLLHAGRGRGRSSRRRYARQFAPCNCGEFRTVRLEKRSDERVGLGPLAARFLRPFGSPEREPSIGQRGRQSSPRFGGEFRTERIEKRSDERIGLGPLAARFPRPFGSPEREPSIERPEKWCPLRELGHRSDRLLRPSRSLREYSLAFERKWFPPRPKRDSAEILIRAGRHDSTGYSPGGFRMKPPFLFP